MKIFALHVSLFKVKLMEKQTVENYPIELLFYRKSRECYI